MANKSDIKTQMTSKIVTANCLRTGQVVYLGPNGDWRHSIDEAAQVGTQAELRVLQGLAAAAVKSNAVTSVYALDVASTPGGLVPQSMRERIRADHSTTV